MSMDSRMHSVWPWAITISICSLIAAAGLAAFLLHTPKGNPGPPPSSVPPQAIVEKPQRPEGGFVGSQQCAECHSDIAHSFHRTPMGRSLGDDSSSHEDYDHPSFERSPWTYKVERTDQGIWHHEMMSDAEGQIYDQAEQIQYVMGSNTRGRSYLLWRDGLMFVSPVAWYSDTGWDLAPGYKVGRHQRFSRRVTEGCLVCHSGRYEHQEGRADYFPLPVFLEASIGCERCHGPGQKHVQFRRQESVAEHDPIPDLNKLGPQERDALCYQCHFQGEDRFLRYGRNEADFRPGMKVSDIWAIVVKKLPQSDNSMAAVAQPMQMESSRCFQKSDGRMGCVSCHDPHETPKPERIKDYYNLRCLNCHADHSCSIPKEQQNKAPADGACAHCHMPASRAKNVPHAALTDHRILRRPLKGGRDDGTLTIYDADGATLSKDEQSRARAIILVRFGSARRDRQMVSEGVRILKSLVAQLPDDEELLFQLGMGSAATENMQEAVAAWKKLIELSPQHESGLLQLANAEHDASHYQEADQLYARFNELNSRQAIAHGRWAHTLGRLNRMDDAIEQGEQALKLDPSMWPMCFWLADAYQLKGDQEKSQHYKALGDRISKVLKAAQ